MDNEAAIENNREIIKQVKNMIINQVNEGNNESVVITNVKNFLTEKGVTDISSVQNKQKENIAYSLLEDDLDNEVYFDILIKIYENLLGQNGKNFEDFLKHESSFSKTIFELIAEKEKKNYFIVAERVIKNNSSVIPGLLNNRDNVFHISVKEGKKKSFLFFYCLFYQFYPNCLNSCNQNNDTPLHIACYWDKPDMVEMLIELGVDINPVNKYGETPLFKVISNWNSGLAKKLIIFGADKNIKNSKGRSPLDLAKINKNNKLYEVLQTFTIFEKIFCFKTEITSMKDYNKCLYLLIGLIVLLVFHIIMCCISFSHLLDKWKLNKSTADSYKTFNTLSSIFDLSVILVIIGFKMWKKSYMEKGIGNYVRKVQSNKVKEVSDSSIINDSQSQLTFDTKETQEGNTNLSLDDPMLLYHLAENTDNICLSCKKKKSKTTVHCSGCNYCFEDFDHHCFFVNCCICKANKKLFLSFLCFISLFFWSESSNLILYIIIVSQQASVSKGLKIFLGFVFGFFAMLFLLLLVSTLFPFIYNWCVEKKKEKGIKKEIKETQVVLIE